jgi:Transposase DDE domain
MANQRKSELLASDVKGIKYFSILNPLLERLHHDATARDRAGKRQLFFDQYAGLLLLYFFSPIVDSLRGLQQASQLGKVQKILGCTRASLGSLSEAARVFDPQLLSDIIHELGDRAQPTLKGREAEALRGLTAVDGSLLPALPKMAWALWQDDQHRAAKMHLHFDVLKGVPTQVTITPGNGNERDQLRLTLEPHRLYVIDRGYAEYAFFQQIMDAGSSFVGRIRDDAVFRVKQERPLTTAAQKASVVRDVIVNKLGTDHHKNEIKQPLRIVIVATGKTNPDGTPDVLVLCTDQLDLAAELVALAYRYRWSVELFFRWFKCILGCRHLLSGSENGVTIQIYLGIIASLLISLWTGRKPTKRTFEMFCFYACGLATEDELQAHITSLQPHN